jgi:hypothetical protein
MRVPLTHPYRRCCECDEQATSMWSAGDGGPSTVAVWYCSKHFPFKPKPYNINEDVEIWRVRYEEAQAMHDEMANKVRDLMQERDAAVADAERLRGAFQSVVRLDSSFSWNGEKQCHTPWIMVEFAEVPSGEPNTAQGWRDRDTFAAAIDAARKEGR